MAAKFVLSERALKDLDDIWDDLFHRSGSPEVADRVLAVITSQFTFLGENPEAGHFREDLAPKPVKFWRVYSHLIVYRTGESVSVARVVSSAQNFTSGDLN